MQLVNQRLILYAPHMVPAEILSCFRSWPAESFAKPEP